MRVEVEGGVGEEEKRRTEREVREKRRNSG